MGKISAEESEDDWDFSTPDRTEKDRVFTALGEITAWIDVLRYEKGKPEKLKRARQMLKQVLQAYREIAQNTKINWRYWLEQKKDENTV